MFQLDFLIAAKLIHIVSNVVFKALEVLLVGAAVEEVDKICIVKSTLTKFHIIVFATWN